MEKITINFTIEKQNTSSVIIFYNEGDWLPFPPHWSSVFRGGAVHKHVLPPKSSSFKNPLYILPRMYWKISGKKHEISCLNKCAMVHKQNCLDLMRPKSFAFQLIMRIVDGHVNESVSLAWAQGTSRDKDCLIKPITSNLMQIRNVFIVWWELWINEPHYT